jgi:hypothetical protein
MRRRSVENPAGGVGSMRIAGHKAGFGVTAPRTFECTMLETFGAG